MAEEDLDLLDDVEMLEEEEDNAKALTSGLVLTTTGVLVLAFIFMEMALGKWYGLGPFAP